MTDALNCKPVVILGAPRSGTNMLRDLLTVPTCVGTWPCDEINPIWRYTHVQHPTDELPPSFATDNVRSFVRAAFARQARRQNVDYIVEKTCANSLRVAFVNRIVPEAQYIFIHRDAVDCIASASLRWHATFDLMYSLRKARYVPFADIPYYARKVLSNRLHSAASSDGRLSFWGPTSEDMKVLPIDTETEIICAHQWRTCVEKAVRDLADISPGRTYHVRYEDFVHKPGEHLADIFAFLGAEVTKEEISDMTGSVSSASVNKGRARLSDKQLEMIEAIVAPIMAELDTLNVTEAAARKY